MGRSRRPKVQSTSSKRPSSIIIGAAGEHYVLYRLLRLNLRAGLPPAGTPEVDLLIVDERASVITSLQVKTRTKGPDGGWHMRDKHERIIGPRLLYVFLDFEPGEPVTYVIPSSVVANYVKTEHEVWLATPGLRGQPHNDNAGRRLLPRHKYLIPGFPDGWMDQYRERWDLLGAT